MSKPIYEFGDYKAYLNQRLDESGRGARARLSKAIGCQTAFTAQVLRGTAHFSLEHSEAINDFLGHTDEQGHYFLLLVQHHRAGSPKLRARFLRQISTIQESQLVLKHRLKVPENLTLQEQVSYYSAWYYSAIHALASIPQFNRVDKISRYLTLDEKLVNEVVEFLVSAGLLIQGKRGLKVGTAHLHLGSDSPLVAKHHTNWRIEAIRSLEKAAPEDLHYSSVVSVSYADCARIRKCLIEAIEAAKTIVRTSPEERLQVISLDFFQR